MKCARRGLWSNPPEQILIMSLAARCDWTCSHRHNACLVAMRADSQQCAVRCMSHGVCSLSLPGSQVLAFAGRHGRCAVHLCLCASLREVAAVKSSHVSASSCSRSCPLPKRLSDAGVCYEGKGRVSMRAVNCQFRSTEGQQIRDGHIRHTMLA